jgi:1,4-dihydroxy-6-naphthoate synthase
VSARLRVGLSPCPNDVFAFHGLLSGASDRLGLELDFALLDVQELNERLARGELDVGKASFAQALSLARDFGVLPVGAALGFGVGPLLLAREGAAGRAAGPLAELPDERARVLCPGAGTTATLLLRMLVPRATNVAQVRFDRIMPALAAGEADFGVVIHEGRFTYERHGLVRVADLGELWERRTKAPLPLGGVLARKSLGAGTHRRFAAALRASLDHARAHPEEAFAAMRRHAQELDAATIWRHVELYVNERTRDLGPEGRAALAAFERESRAAGLVARDAPPLEVLGS